MRKIENEKGNIEIIAGVLVGAIILILTILFASITTVPTGYVGVKTRFGQVQEATIQEVSNLAQETLTNKLKDNGINITSLSMTDLSFSEEFDQAIEKKQVVEQQTQQAKYELEKAKVENEKKVENAKAEAEVMKQQNQEITDKTLELKRLEVQQKLIEKWNGQLPTTSLGDNIPMLNIGK